jgi:hypothetical protein
MRGSVCTLHPLRPYGTTFVPARLLIEHRVPLRGDHLQRRLAQNAIAAAFLPLRQTRIDDTPMRLKPNLNSALCPRSGGGALLAHRAALQPGLIARGDLTAPSPPCRCELAE